MSKENLIPEGTYDAVGVDRPDEQGVCAYARLAETKNGDPQVIAFFNILNLPEGVSQRFPLRRNGSFKKTLVGPEGKQRTLARITCESLRAMGWKSNDITDIEKDDLDQIVSVTVDHEEHEGKWYARIGWVNAAGGGAVKIKAMDDAAKRKFAAMMTSNVASVPLVAGKKAGASSAAAPSNGAQTSASGHEEPPPPEDYDDIPF